VKRFFLKEFENNAHKIMNSVFIGMTQEGEYSHVKPCLTSMDKLSAPFLAMERLDMTANDLVRLK